MAEFLLEIYSEEIPAGMQTQSINRCKEALRSKFIESGIARELDIKAEISPCRMLFYIDSISINITKEEKLHKGPSVGSRQEAIEGFFKRFNLTGVNQLIINNGFYYYQEKASTIKTFDLIKNIMPTIIASFANVWPKQMQWSESGISWIRPIRNILCIFDSCIVDFHFGHLAANSRVYGHKTIANKNQGTILSYHEYCMFMKDNFVIFEKEKRKDIIIKQIAYVLGDLKLVKDDNLLEEVIGLVEYPVTLIGKIEQEFLNLPPEVLILVMKKHQRYFALQDKNGKLAPYFIVVTDCLAGNKDMVVAGHERVLKARFNDARFFYEQDTSVKFENRLDDLKKLVFHSKLGSVYDRVGRIYGIATRLLSSYLIEDKNLLLKELKVVRNLFKNDLTTQMVAEFPELQGIIGGYYAEERGKQGISEEDSSLLLLSQAASKERIINAIKEQYLPAFEDDKLPSNPLSTTISLADKIEFIASLWYAKEKPTSSKDPFAIRRRVIGIIRICIENNVRVDLQTLLDDCVASIEKTIHIDQKNEIVKDIILFVNERLKIYLKKRYRSDIVDAVLNDQRIIDVTSCRCFGIFLLSEEVRLLTDFFATNEGILLQGAYKRVVSILNIEEKSMESFRYAQYRKGKDQSKAEKELYEALKLCQDSIKYRNDYTNYSNEEFMKKCNQLVSLYEPINSFFDNVKVNDNNQELKHNLLSLLGEVREVVKRVIDLELIS